MVDLNSKLNVDGINLKNLPKDKMPLKNLTDEVLMLIYKGQTNKEGKPHGLGRLRLCFATDYSFSPYDPWIFDGHF